MDVQFDEKLFFLLTKAEDMLTERVRGFGPGAEPKRPTLAQVWSTAKELAKDYDIVTETHLALKPKAVCRGD